MELKTNILIEQISNLHDARYCAGMGVQYLEFQFDQNTQTSIKVEDYKEISGWITGIKKVGTINQTENLDVSINDLALDYLKTSNIDVLKKNKEQSLIFEINQISEDIKMILTELKGEVSFFVIPYQEDIEKSRYTALCQEFPIFLKGKFTGDAALEVIENINPYGLMLEATGGKEIKVGVNDFDELADVLEAIEILDF